MATASTGRIGTLDFVRGVAVMGILLLNIVSFGMPIAAYVNPLAYGGADGIDLAVYLTNFVLFDGKMRGLFSFLFGASMLLVLDRAAAAGLDPVAIHTRRMLVLFCVGIAHLLLIWRGDILHHYAIVGMIAVLFRRASVARLVGWGIALIVLQTLNIGSLVLVIASATHDVAGNDPKAAASGAQFLAEMAHGFGTPSPAAELALYRGGYADVVAGRFATSWSTPMWSLLQVGLETLGYMLFGMAAFRSGLLTGDWLRVRYVRWLAISLTIGLTGYTLLAIDMVRHGFALQTMVRDWLMLTTPLRPFMVVGWACLLNLTMRPGGWLTGRIAAAGRMAFTNYLMTSILCSTFFNGYGLGMFGHLSRAGLYFVVAAMWALILFWSRPWLERFRFGPFEWAWRSLARWEWQPMRVEPTATTR
ncbi:DUF418 domain-containing protein [Sphingomonas sp. CFBP 13720]|uniref:DUF418 domain-containing protein n=1 Tax=Sphingomonas sp. CFBP 13720 TaxID=2775302 RepID=UPI00177C42B1|nr:DUF418 domain-containing protein [Sphingomonas sp. CFBP 13720]MBD8677743.1 DUF418 domain-containing protein [Sphingomonas sp. CFBP 13720]